MISPSSNEFSLKEGVIYYNKLESPYTRDDFREV